MEMKIDQVFEDLKKKQASLYEKRISGKDGGDRSLGELVRLLELEAKLLTVVGDINAALGGKRSFSANLPDQTLSNSAEDFLMVGKRALPTGTKLETSYKGKRFKAVVNEDGKIVYKGQMFNSIAMLATEITGKEKNHLRSRKFWQIDLP